MTTQTRSVTFAKVFVATAVIFFLAVVSGFAAVSGAALLKKQTKVKVAPVPIVCGLGLLTADYIVRPTPVNPFEYALPSLAFADAQVYGDRDGDGVIKICLRGGSSSGGAITYTQTGTTIDLDLAPWSTSYGTGTEPVLIFSDAGSQLTHWENPSATLLHPYDSSAAPTSLRMLTIQRIGFTSGPLAIAASNTSVNLTLVGVLMDGLSSVSSEAVGVLAAYSSQLIVRNSTFSNLLGKAFLLTGEVQATFENNTFDSNEANRGSAISLAGSAVVSDVGSTYSGNEASTAPYGEGGGAIYLSEEADYSGRNVVFTGNISQQAGGAIYADGSDISIDLANAIFENNQAATGGGGAIFHNTNYLGSGSLKVQDSTFSQNSAPSGTGGGVWVSGETVVRVARAQFTDNAAATAGALSAVNITDVLIESSQFQSNEAGIGGALFVSGGNVDVVESTFTQNSAGQDGGAIYVLDNSDVLVEVNVFTDNSARANGGAIAVNASDTSVVIDGSTFNGNQAGTTGYGYGGALSCVDNQGISAFDVGTSSFDGNMAASANWGFGGAISVDGCDLSVEDHTTFTNNVAGNAGGAIWGSSNNLPVQEVVLDIASASFIGNEATMQGGAVRTASLTQSFVDVLFEGNISAEGGAMLSLATDSGLKEVSFINNLSHGAHGAFQFNWMGVADTSTSMVGVTATGNSAITHGVGSILGGEFEGEAMDVRDNSSHYAPAGISLQPQKGIIHNAVFARNVVGTNHPTLPSALNVDPLEAGTVEVDYLTFADNSGTIAAITGPDSSFEHLIASHNNDLQMQGYASSSLDYSLLWAVPPGVSANGAWDLFDSGVGNIDAEPLYIGDGTTTDPTLSTDILNFDFHLQPGSPGVDIDSSETDVDGSPADAGAYGGSLGNW
ncbi:MAG: right-handed parallel beta-helix repeat-containing protein [Patescibacteria group bacterium]